MSVYKVPMVICEGPSEVNYITELNRLLVKKNSYSLLCKPLSADGGDFASIVSKIKSCRRGHRGVEILVWVDKDLYARNSHGCMKKYQNKGEAIPDFMFSEMNFEDFLALHYPFHVVGAYEKELRTRNHFENPLTSDEILSCFKQFVCAEYEKGTLPFDLDKSRLDTLFNNLGKFNIKCGFAEWLKKQFDSELVDYRK